MEALTNYRQPCSRDTCAFHVCVRAVAEDPEEYATAVAVIILWPRVTPHLRR